MNLDKSISELLYHYDCVIVPEFGGFVTNYKAAHLDKRLHLFHPPSKELSFNKNLVRNDGLLANYLSDFNDCTFEEANQFIKQSVEDYFAKLNNGERIEFKKVGIIYRDSDTNLRFQPIPGQNFLKDAFGLDELFAAPVAKTVVQTEVKPAPKPQPAPKQAAEKTPVIPIQRGERTTKKAEEKSTVKVSAQAATLRADEVSNRRWIWAAAITLPFVAYAGWLLTTADLRHPQNLTIADLNPFGKKAPSTYAQRAASDHHNELTNDHDNFTDLESMDETLVQLSFVHPPNDPGVFVRLKEEVKPAAVVNTYVAPTEIKSMRYHVVGGCFSEEYNAQRLVDKLRERGYNAYILDHHKGLFRVTYGNYTRRSEALESLRRVKDEELKSAWLLVI